MRQQTDAQSRTTHTPAPTVAPIRRIRPRETFTITIRFWLSHFQSPGRQLDLPACRTPLPVCLFVCRHCVIHSTVITAVLNICVVHYKGRTALGLPRVTFKFMLSHCLVLCDLFRTPPRVVACSMFARGARGSVSSVIRPPASQPQRPATSYLLLFLDYCNTNEYITLLVTKPKASVKQRS